ncbi:TPA: glycosyltransferase [Serratia rubidaea]|nr:glycosyltransferase [Serratia rubidaea]HDJ1447880.1 glycosyltransferase [Serratia rubidaea]HDJ1460272.1 glycosyltransferase [Serratia rubidaea]HDJ2771554.1 glycosyltransferase [Serratia rubidaea]
MRIDYVITGLDIGGAEFQVVALLERLVQRGHQVRLISMTPPRAFTERLESAGIPVHSLDMTSGLQLPQALWRLKKMLRQSPPDILHGHMVHANIIARLARLFIPGLHVISTAHNTREGGKLRDWAYRLTNPLSRLNTTISAAATRRFTEEKVFPRHNTQTIFNGIDTEKFHADDAPHTPAKPFRWLAVGRLMEQKDYPTMLTAFSLLPDSRLLIAGQGPLLPQLQEQVSQLGLENRVEFLGVRHDIDELYRQVDGFVLSSEWEGYGLVVAEAMASQLPVVVTDSGGPGEIVGSDGSAGLLVPIKDPQALANALSMIEAMPPASRYDMGCRARKKIQENFSLNQIVTQWENIYTELNKKNK